MIDHLGLSVTNFQRSKEFYRRALEPLGYAVVMEFAEGPGVAGFGAGGKPDFWIYGRGQDSTKVHVAIAAANRAAVDAFFKAAVAAGGTDNGKPGLRPEYHADYYGAFVLDPDGHNIEAVTHVPE